MKNKLIIRKPTMKDTPQLLKLINDLIKEKAFIVMQEEQNMQGEKKWLKEMIKNIKLNKSVFLIAELDGQIIGSSSISKGSTKGDMHSGEIGIIIHQNARGMGIGKKLFESVILDVKKKLKLKIITLNLAKPNKIALKLYKKCGFQVVGIIKNGFHHYGRYYDKVIMVKYL